MGRMKCFTIFAASSGVILSKFSSFVRAYSVLEPLNFLLGEGVLVCTVGAISPIEFSLVPSVVSPACSVTGMEICAS